MDTYLTKIANSVVKGDFYEIRAIPPSPEGLGFSRILMKKLLLALSFGAISLSAIAQENPILDALAHGEATYSLNSDPKYAKVVQALQKSTKNDGEIIMRFKLVTKFKQQPTCGRVSFWGEQPSTNTKWGQMGGDINYCEDGMPPLRICAENPKQLVAPDANCKGGKAPIDTPEIAAAIKYSLDHGGMTEAQAKAKYKADLENARAKYKAENGLGDSGAKNAK